MIENLKHHKKQIALFISSILLVVAAGYICLVCVNKTLTIKVNERVTAQSTATVNKITGANLNKTLREVLDENAYPTNDNYVYDVNLDTKVKDVDTVNIEKKVSGEIKIDGQTLPFDSGADDIKSLLEELGIHMSTIDYTEPPDKTVLSEEIKTITVHRQSLQREEREEAIPYEIEERYDKNLDQGEVIVDFSGIEGKQLVTEDVKYQDGIPIERTLVNQELLLEPVAQVVRIGTKTGDTSSNISNLAYNGTNLNQEDYNLVCAIVEHEAGSDYTSALAVMTCVMNRVDSPNYPDDPVSVLTAPGQFESYLGGYYKQYLGKSSVSVRQAVNDCLAGKRIHNYLNFRSYRTENSEKIGGNWFFND